MVLHGGKWYSFQDWSYGNPEKREANDQL